ncbi:MAG TPA: DUF4012 domain-containing protein, partial [Ktedonobacterales bacterium]|nr:DUF4012 domain-containing protein [Ktedonobacterales bacterium]
GAGGVWAPPEQRDWYDEDDDALSRSLNTLARLGAVGEPIGRIARIRMLFRTRPAAAAMLALFLLGFMLTCCAPVIPLLRLGYDVSDALQRVNTLQGMFSDTSSLLSAPKLKDAQGEVDALTHDLYEINSAMNIAGAPFAAVSSTVRSYRLLTRIGFDLTASADEGLQVAQTLLTPLQGGALAADTSTPGLTADDIAQARGVLADASVRIQDALAAYQQFDPNVLKGPLKKLGKYLSLLPMAPAVLGEFNRLLDSAPALLGIGQPANYLVLVMDRSELRPAGGFMGNYGILTLEGGKQSAKYPLALDDTYNVDFDYFKTHVLNPNQPYCQTEGPQPPNYYWWWPVRNDPACLIAWGLRDSGLSADFPTNALTAEQIVTDTPNKVPNTGKLQGVIAFTPILIEELLQVTGPITVPEWNYTVSAQILEHAIHEHQLGAAAPKGKPRKTFTHDLAAALLTRIKTAHGSELKAVLKIAETALKDKDLQLYFNDPQAELILRQLGLSSKIS